MEFLKEFLEGSFQWATGTLGALGIAGFGLALFLLSSWSFMWLKNRSFRRRNQLGVEMFTSYSKMLSVRYFEYTIRLLAMFGLILGSVMVIWGVVMLSPSGTS